MACSAPGPAATAFVSQGLLGCVSRARVQKHSVAYSAPMDTPYTGTPAWSHAACQHQFLHVLSSLCNRPPCFLLYNAPSLANVCSSMASLLRPCPVYITQQHSKWSQAVPTSLHVKNLPTSKLNVHQLQPLRHDPADTPTPSHDDDSPHGHPCFNRRRPNRCQLAHVFLMAATTGERL